jgi:hypothetical protein
VAAKRRITSVRETATLFSHRVLMRANLCLALHALIISKLEIKGFK